MSGPVDTLDRDDAQMRAYLLGQLREEEGLALEDRYFADEDCYDKLLEVQYELIDEHARGGLTASEREAVEQRLLASADGSRRAVVARALHQRGQRQATPRSISTRGSAASSATPRARNSYLAAAAVIAIAASAASVWFGMENARLRRELASVGPAPAPPPQPQPPPPTIATAPDQPPLVAEVTLIARVLRGDQASPTVTIPSATDFVRLGLATDETAPSFTLGIEKAGVGRVWSQSGLMPSQNGALVLWLPADVLAAGDYEILLWREREDPAALVAVYTCRVTRE